MDFLDPKRQRRAAIRLLIGYGVLIIAGFIAVQILLNINTNGYGINKNGQVIQNGLLFVASTPSGAKITLSGSNKTPTTNTRLSLVSGPYQMTLNRAGYRTWQQAFTLPGAQVLRIDYAFLFPTQLKTTTLKNYDATNDLATQSPDRRWVLIQLPGTNNFDLFDLKNTKTPATPTQVNLPAGLVSTGTISSWMLAEWSDDNQHVLLIHTFDGKTEYVLVDRADATKSVNLNQILNTTPTKLTLLDKKYDQYYVYDAQTQALQTARLNTPTLQPFLSNVLSYQSYGSNIMLYASSKTASDGKVAIDLLQGGKTYLMREVAASSTYLLNLTQYDGDWYVAAGASSESKVYIYKNPLDQLNSTRATLVPIAILKTPNPNYLTFSSNAQYIMDENGSQFSVYDILYDKNYRFDTKLALDAPQAHANWMDAARLDYVTAGKLVVFDFDNANRQTLIAADPHATPFFSPDYKFVDVLTPQAKTPGLSLTTTSLRTPADR